MKKITLGDFLTDKQIKACIKIFKDNDDSIKARLMIRDNVLNPVMDDINKKIGQENDVDYLSYLIIHVLEQSK